MVIEQLAPTSVQFVSVVIPNEPVPYYVANVIALVDCLDEKLSHVERFAENDPVRPDLAGEISLIIDLHIDAERATGHHIFRLKGYDSAAIVSQDLKELLEKAGICGLKYVLVTSSTIAEYRVRLLKRQTGKE